MDVLVGTATSVLFELQGATGTLVPDPGSAFYRIYDQSGLLIAGPTALPTTPVTSTLVIPALAPVNTITAPHRFEKRTVYITWTSAGASYSLRQSYRIIPFINLTATAASVRAALSLSDDEVDDADIDLFAAYLQIDAELKANLAATVTIDTALASGTRLELAANSAIVHQAAIALLPTLELRAAMSVTDGTQTFERFHPGVVFSALKWELKLARERAMIIVIGIPVTNPLLVVFSLPTDPVTNI